MNATRPFVAVLAIAACCQAVGDAPTSSPVPIVYSTDLYHPHGDPDDHFDLMTLFALPEFDIRAIVIDMGERGKGHPGTLTLNQAMHITGRTVPYATGLLTNLETPQDKTTNQPDETQAGVHLICKALQEAERPVTVFVTGSLRDVAAAYNRKPDLFKAKVARVYVNAGHSSGGREWNVGLDPHAFVRILRSGLPIYWVPCFGDAGYASLWKFKHADVLADAPPAVQNFFIYALTKADPNRQDPIAALDAAPPQEVVDTLWAKERNMWCTGAFLHAASRSHASFSFDEATIRIADDGTTRIVDGVDGVDGVVLPVFHVTAQDEYTAAMTGVLKGLLEGMK